VSMQMIDNLKATRDRGPGNLYTASQYKETVHVKKNGLGKLRRLT
jgi:hypothetical protein